MDIEPTLRKQNMSISYINQNEPSYEVAACVISFQLSYSKEELGNGNLSYADVICAEKKKFSDVQREAKLCAEHDFGKFAVTEFML
jgi:hypothetical protein